MAQHLVPQPATNCMKRTTWQANSFSVIQEIARRLSNTKPQVPNCQPLSQLQQPALPVLLVTALAALPTAALLGLEPMCWRCTVPPSGQVELGRGSPDAVAWTAATSTAHRFPGWRTFIPSGLPVSHCPLQHETQHLPTERERDRCSAVLQGNKKACR